MYMRKAQLDYFKQLSGQQVQEQYGKKQSKSKFEFEEVKEEDVLELLKGLDPNKACGADGIGAKLLTMVAPGICSSLTSLFNSSLKS